MTLIDVAIVVAVLLFLALLVRAAFTLSQNPYQQIRAHEDLAGRSFPPDMTHGEKLRLIDRFGVSPTNPKSMWRLLVLLAAVIAVLVWQR